MSLAFEFDASLWNLTLPVLCLATACGGPLITESGETDSAETEGTDTEAFPTSMTGTTTLTTTMGPSSVTVTPGECVNDLDCEPNQWCDDGECVGGGPHCDYYDDYDCCYDGCCDGGCHYECYGDVDCGDNELCLDYYCVEAEQIPECGSEGALAEIPFPAGAGVEAGSLAFADLDGDGDEELLVGRADGLEVITASASLGFIANADPVLSVTAGNLTGDANTDVAFSDASGFRVFAGDGTGALTEAVTSPAGPHRGLFAGDFNGDGLQDLVGRDGQELRFYRADATFGFGSGVEIASGFESYAVGIVDDDGLPDVIVDSFAGPLAYRSGDDFPDTQSTFEVSNNVPNRRVGVGDIDGDGAGDVLQLGFTYQATAVFTWRALTPTSSVPFVLPGQYEIITVGDVNGDGRDDLYLTGQQQTSIVFGDPDAASGLGCYSSLGGIVENVLPVAGDIDGDGNDEIAVATFAGIVLLGHSV